MLRGDADLVVLHGAVSPGQSCESDLFQLRAGLTGRELETV